MLEQWDNGNTFHNLDTDVLNAEIKALHHGAHLFFEITEVKNKLHSLIQNLTLFKDVSQLKIGKLAGSYRLPMKDKTDWNVVLLRIFVKLLFFKKDKEK